MAGSAQFEALAGGAAEYFIWRLELSAEQEEEEEEEEEEEGGGVCVGEVPWQPSLARAGAGSSDGDSSSGSGSGSDGDVGDDSADGGAYATVEEELVEDLPRYVLTYFLVLPPSSSDSRLTPLLVSTPTPLLRAGTTTTSAPSAPACSCSWTSTP